MLTASEFNWQSEMSQNWVLFRLIGALRPNKLRKDTISDAVWYLRATRFRKQALRTTNSTTTLFRRSQAPLTIRSFTKHVGSQDSQSRVPISAVLLSRVHSITSYPCSSWGAKEQLIGAVQSHPNCESNARQPNIKVCVSPFPLCSADISRTHYNFSNLPADPSFYRIDDSNLFIKFYNYGLRIDARSTYGALQIAVEDVMIHILPDTHRGDIVIPRRPNGYTYGTGNVRLRLMTQPDMTWGMWGETLRGLRQFGQSWAFVELNFDTIEGGVTVGSGKIWELQ